MQKMQFNGIVIYLSSSDQRNLQNGLIADARFFSKIVSRNHDRFRQSNSFKYPLYLENCQHLSKRNIFKCIFVWLSHPTVQVIISAKYLKFYFIYFYMYYMRIYTRKSCYKVNLSILYNNNNHC